MYAFGIDKPFSIVGVLNVTPDSYFDGGKHTSLEKALEHALAMMEDGADIVDIGGESTFVDRHEVSVDEELSRVIPVIRAIKEQAPKAVLSIDTSKSKVAREAITAGVSIINDVTAGRGDEAMFSVAAGARTPIVLMYAKDSSSRTTTDAVEYKDVMHTVTDFLQSRITAAVAQGMEKSQIIVDPGLGFFVSGNAKYSFEILAKLPQLKTLGFPIFISPSRKSFLAGPEKLPPSERLPATIAASVAGMLNGATYIRTHDVKEVRRACEIAEEILGRMA